MSEPHEVEPLEGVILPRRQLSGDGRDLDIQQREYVGRQILQQMRECEA
jgi:hypothetical protein